jgi:hypothetical protein
MTHVEQLTGERIAEERKSISERQDRLFKEYRFHAEYETSLLEVLNLIEQAKTLDEMKFALLDFVVATKNEVFALRDDHDSLSSKVESMNDYPDPDES